MQVGIVLCFTEPSSMLSYFQDAIQKDCLCSQQCTKVQKSGVPQRIKPSEYENITAIQETVKMIINFKLENWKSFSGATSFSMVARGKHGHVDRLQRAGPNELRLLPVAAIFGGNASGKSNFVKALSFAREFIVHGNQNGNGKNNHFLLGDRFQKLPTKFSFELLIDEKIFLYDFTICKSEVLSESLSEMEGGNRKNIYNVENNNIEFCSNLEDKNSLKLLFEITKNNQVELFMSFLGKNSVDNFPVYKWFKENLQIIFPKSGMDLEKITNNDLIFQTMNKALKTLDCGAVRLDFVDYSPSEAEFAEFKDELDRNRTAVDPQKMIIGKIDEDGYVFKKLMTFHRTEENGQAMLEMDVNSNGTKRMFELLPAVIGLTEVQGCKVCVIDELDQSLHVKLIKSLITAYLDNCYNDNKSQLIFTSHNVMIMDKSIFRTDEMWLTKRNKYGSTDLYSIGSFKDVDLEKNIRESYLGGRFGGIPRMLLIEDQLKIPRKVDEVEND